MSVAVLGVVGARGGSLATTVSANVAGLLARSGNRVLLVTTDPVGGPQRDLGVRIGRDALVPGVRPGLDLLASFAPIASPARTVTALARDYDLVLVDASGRGDASRVALAVCDRLLVTVRPDAPSCASAGHAFDGFVGVPLGAVLVAVPPRPRGVASQARRDLDGSLGQRAPSFVATVRSEAGVAWAARRRGLLVHEWAVEGGASDDGADDPPVRGLARDLAEVAEEIVLRLDH